MNRSAFQRGAFQADAFQINHQVLPESIPTSESWYRPTIRERITVQLIFSAGPKGKGIVIAPEPEKKVRSRKEREEEEIALLLALLD